MTSVEMAYEWKITFESMASGNAPGYTDREVSVLLTQAEEEVTLEVAKTLQDGNDYARMVLEKLLTPYNNPTVTTYTTIPNAYSVALPTGKEIPTPIPEFFYPFVEFVNDRAVKPIDYNSYYTSISNPWAKPYEDLYWRLIDNGKLIIITDGITPVTASSVKGLYVTKPAPIIVSTLTAQTSIDGAYIAADCLLHPIVHRDIVYKAAKKAFAAMKDQAGYQIQNIEENQ